ncbi:DUF3168 domain-containing protein [Mangrovicella endophytica]|uniref:DUF3168 domain-containing protein n=1 Tax=Mangrovicella endophytica TaxID=2066697 RepID=UPI000C9DDA99|nr:DUF3168 domain-containing protein [Mangrovicella endophytica]
MSAAYAVQKAIRGRLIDTAAVLALVPADSILDRNSRPAPDPSIILGEDQEIDEGDIARRTIRVVSTLHVWKRETGLAGVKAISGAIRTAMRAALPPMDGWHFADCRVSSIRFLRDPDGETAHAVVTIETLAGEVD